MFCFPVCKPPIPVELLLSSLKRRDIKADLWELAETREGLFVQCQGMKSHPHSSGGTRGGCGAAVLLCGVPTALCSVSFQTLFAGSFDEQAQHFRCSQLAQKLKWNYSPRPELRITLSMALLIKNVVCFVTDYWNLLVFIFSL